MREKYCYLVGGWRLELQGCERKDCSAGAGRHQPNAVNGSTRLPAPNNPGHFGQTSSDVEQIRDGTENSMNSLTLTNIEGR